MTYKYVSDEHTFSFSLLKSGELVVFADSQRLPSAHPERYIEFFRGEATSITQNDLTWEYDSCATFALTFGDYSLDTKYFTISTSEQLDIAALIEHVAKRASNTTTVTVCSDDVQYLQNKRFGG